MKQEPANDSWSVATAEDNGKPLIIRIRNNIPPGVETEVYPNLIAISWEYESPDSSGMPSQQDKERMDLLEDLLNEALESKSVAYLTVVVTGNGIREWQWYAKDIQQTMDAVNQALSGYDPFPVQFSSELDSDWEAYRKFIE